MTFVAVKRSTCHPSADFILVRTRTNVSSMAGFFATVPEWDRVFCYQIAASVLDPNCIREGTPPDQDLS